MKQSNPVIVVVAYNRSDSLQRLLNSLLHARDVSEVKLIISIDNQEPHNYDVKEVAESYNWPFGSKEVWYQSEHLGLKKHIMLCGDLAIKYGSVIVLEDDLLVSPYFYQYAKAAMEYYSEENKIGGISLYKQPRQEIVKLPFAPVSDGSDVYFIQWPSSLGQLWTNDQWAQFRSWYDSGPDLTKIPIPDYIYNWPETSWKKYYAAFLVDQDKYFVYPRISLSTNFFDLGTHMKNSMSHRGQTPLKLFSSVYRFLDIFDSNCIYDINLELLPDCVKNLSVKQIDYDFELDLYGSKELHTITAPYVITSRPCNHPIQGYRRALKPHEMNILMDLEGDDLVLCRKEDVIYRNMDSPALLAEFEYYYTDFIKGTKFLIYRYFRKWKWLSNLFK